MLNPCRALLCVSALWLAADAAWAQQLAGPEGTTFSDLRELISRDWHFVGNVEMELGDIRLYAGEVWYYTDARRVVAADNVVFSQGTNRIAADRAEVDLETRLATFHNASGFASIQQPASPRGATPSPSGNTDIYFFGETIEKIGPKKYRISNGGFTTCVQPAPRWEISANSLILNIDDYTLLRQAILRVKGVPLFYLPILYYPTTREDRATGILLPTYGVSTIRGQSISNALFWAINRSQDATILHDWFSKTGQGVGGEYRYALEPGSDGSARVYVLDQHEASYTLSNGDTSSLDASRSFEIRGGANQRLPGNLYARGQVDYFSNISTSQTFSSNVYDASRTRRSYGGNVVGSWGNYSLNGTYDHKETFYGTTESVVIGDTPRVGFSRNERPLTPRSPVYFSLRGEYSRLRRQTRADDSLTDSGLSRVDFMPTIRVPFNKWQWLTVNSSLSWRNTYYTRSRAPETSVLTDDALNRRYFTLVAQAVGPVLNRIWDAPNNAYAERFKHTIEPYLNVKRTSSIDNFSRIVRTDGADGIVGDATSYTYGVRNRLYAKRRIGGTDARRAAQAREIVSVALSQSYYTDQRSAQFDLQYSTSNSGVPPSRFSPIALDVRATPANSFNATLRAEFDSRYRQLRTLSVAGSYDWGNRLETRAGWSQRYFIEELPGFNDPERLNHYVNGSIDARTDDDRFGGIYSFNFDVLRSRMLQQRFSAFYNAQCCGIALEYQRFNFASGNRSAPIPSDRRLFLSFTLAGLGSFSPFSDAMSSVPR